MTARRVFLTDKLPKLTKMLMLESSLHFILFKNHSLKNK